VRGYFLGVTTMQSPLRERHEKMGVQWCESLGASVPCSYGDVQDEYSALRNGTGVIDLSTLGKLWVTGSDRIAYLQGQLSQDIAPLTDSGAGAYACLLKPTGQMLSDMVLFAHDNAVTILTPPHTRETVQQRLEQFIIMEDVEIADVSERFALLHIAGPRALAVLEMLGLETHLPLWHCLVAAWGEQTVYLVRTDRTGEQGYDLMVPEEIALTVWEKLLEAETLPVGFDAWNIRRVEAGIPLYGIDMDENTIPLEAGLGDRAISFTKGCYTGQEVIHRIYSRGHTNRSLVGLRVSGDMVPAPSSVIGTADRPQAGWVTSAVFSPSLNAVIALGYLRNEYAAEGTAVNIHLDSSFLDAMVAPLPFVEPSRA